MPAPRRLADKACGKAILLAPRDSLTWIQRAPMVHDNMWSDVQVETCSGRGTVERMLVTWRGQWSSKLSGVDCRGLL